MLVRSSDEVGVLGGPHIEALDVGVDEEEDVPGRDLTLATTAAEELDPIAAITSFYPMVEALARARGKDPDQPRYLHKVTTTR